VELLIFALKTSIPGLFCVAKLNNFGNMNKKSTKKTLILRSQAQNNGD
jgi:hypothetical protein